MEPLEDHMLDTHEGHSMHGLLHAEEQAAHGIKHHGGHESLHLHRAEEREDDIDLNEHSPIHEIVHAEGSQRFHSGPRHHWTEAQKYSIGAHHDTPTAVEHHAYQGPVHHEKLHLHSAHVVAEEESHHVIPEHEHRVDLPKVEHKEEESHEPLVIQHHLSPVTHRREQEEDQHDEDTLMDLKQEKRQEKKQEKKQEKRQEKEEEAGIHKATLHTGSSTEHLS